MRWFGPFWPLWASKPIVMSIDDKVYYPYIIDYKESDFGGVLETTPDYKGYYVTSLLKKEKDI